MIAAAPAAKRTPVAGRVFGWLLRDSFLVCNRDFHRPVLHSCWHARDATLDGSVKLSAPTCKSAVGRVFWLPSVHLEFDFDRCLDLHRDLQAGFGEHHNMAGGRAPRSVSRLQPPGFLASSAPRVRISPLPPFGFALALAPRPAFVNSPLRYGPLLCLRCRRGAGLRRRVERLP
jgi:hypothetical protein